MTTAQRQASRRGLASAGRALVLIARTGLATLLWASMLVAGVSWRLAQAPLDLPSLAGFVAGRASAPDRAVLVGRMLVSWAGFDHRDAQPLRVRSENITVTGRFGTADIGTAEATLRVLPLLHGRLEPTTLDVEKARLRLAAPPAPSQAAEVPDLAALARQLANPSAEPAQAWRRLSELHVHEAAVEAADVPARVSRLDVDLDRRHGGVSGKAVVVVDAQGETATLSVTAELAAGGAGTTLQASLTPLVPARLAAISPQAAPLAALDAPVSLSGAVQLGSDLRPEHATLELAIGAGTIHAGSGTAPVLAADLAAEFIADRLTVRLLKFDTKAMSSRPPTRFSGEAVVTAQGSDFHTVGTLDVDQVDFADLPTLWPTGVGGPGTRPWMTANITAGRLTAGHVALDMTVLGDFSDVLLGHIDAAIDGHDITCHWLRPVPPLEHAEARLTVTDPDVIDIAISSAEQGGATAGGMHAHDALVHLTGIAGNNQFADIRTGLAGPLPDLLAVLNHPRIKLLSRRPLAMRDPRGTVAAQLSVGHLPLRDDVRLDDLVIQATAHTSKVHLGGIVAGFDLDDGMLDLTTNNDALRVTGTARLAGFASHLDIGMDFRDGGADQVQENVTLRSAVETARLGTFGIDPGPAVGGALVLDTHLQARRSGRTQIELAADLTPLTLSEPRLGVVKAAGSKGTARATIVLEGDRLLSVDAVQVAAPGIVIAGAAETAAGRLSRVRLDRVILGGGTDLHGEIEVPQNAGARLALRLAGPRLDVSGALQQRGTFGGGGTSGRPWSVDLAIEQVVLGQGRRLTGVRAVAENDGTLLRRASIDGATGPGARFHAELVPEADGRRLTIDVADTGALLRAADVTDGVVRGKLHVVGRYADTVAGKPLAGLAEMTDFRIRDAPTIARVLKALTIYGLVDLARGPGIGVARLDAPFSWQDDTLTLSEARAFSPSLGVTAQGRVDLGRSTVDLQGTVVPAYFFNSLPGRVPLIGGLFRSERGGGLFSTAVSVRGPFQNLSIGVNPLSTLTPGFLRGLLAPSHPPK